MQPSGQQVGVQNRDERIAHLLEAITADFRRGQAPDFERLRREHPDLSDELRELWATVLIADAVAVQASSAINAQRDEPEAKRRAATLRPESQGGTLPAGEA